MSNNKWRPSSNLTSVQQRARVLTQIRKFFENRHVLEVQTPVVGRAIGTDIYLEPMQTADRYLQTSPEFAMKRLLAAGSGSIYQLGPAFRQEESGRLHNPEFTLLEWYQVGFTHQDLMVEVSDFMEIIAGTKPAVQISYRQLFQQHLHLDPWEDQREIQHYAQTLTTSELNFDDALSLLLSCKIEPKLGWAEPVLIHSFPPQQAALARIATFEGYEVAERFEVYWRGVELANGYHELTDVTEQRQRFLKDNEQRSILGKRCLPLDEHLLAALEYGLPDCAGVALGIDRLLMLMTNAEHIRDVLAFDWDRC